MFNGNPAAAAHNYNNFLLKTSKNIKAQGLNHEIDTQNITLNDKSMFLYPTNSIEILTVAKKLKNKESCGDDEISTNIIKYTIDLILDVLTYIINNSFKFGVFPDDLKLAMVKPIFKKGDPQSLDNYRPISLLPSFSKLFELLMSDRLIAFFNNCNILSESQHAYRKGKSINTAVFQFTNYINEAIENKEIALGVFLDLSKAYDTVDHSLLLNKLEKYGVRGNVLQWFKSYLLNRKQRVGVMKNGKLYKSEIHSCEGVGIPQGSILGPIIFIVYANDMHSLHQNFSHCITNYADDTNFVTKAKGFPELVERCGVMYEALGNWFNKNLLNLNEEKTQSMLFKSKHSNLQLHNIVHLDKQALELSASIKFLGIHIDNALEWHAHVEYLVPKTATLCYILRNIKCYISGESLKIIYHGSFESILRFGIIFWGSCTSMDTLFKLQKRCLRTLYGLKYRESCRGVFKSNKILTVYSLYVYECLLFFFKNKQLFVTTEKPSTYNTRTKDVVYPIHRLTATEKTTKYRCIKFFNKLPRKLQEIQIFNKFKSEVYDLLIKKELYDLRDFI